MNHNSKHIDDLFKEELGNYTETPPPATWNRLEKRLGQPAKPQFSYRRLGYFGILAVVLLFCIPVARQIAGNSLPGSKNIASNDNTISNAGTATKGGAAKTNETQITNDKNNNSEAVNNIQPSGTATAGNDQSKTQGNDRNNVTGAIQKEGTGTANKNNKQRRNGIAKAAKSGKHPANKSKGATDEQEEPENVYGSGATAKNKAQSEKKDEAATIKKQPEELTAANKPVLPKPKTALANNESAKHAPRPKFTRFEAGIKAGYESGFNNDAAKKIVISPYIQYKITPRLAVMLQPAIKSAYLNSRRIGDPKSYYKINADSVSNGVTNPLFTTDGSKLYLTQYTYTETHDSIVKSNYLSGSYMEYELPVLLKYYIGKSFSVYGGVNITYSKLLGVTEHTFTSKPISVQKDSFAITHTVAEATPPPLRSVINDPSGIPISNYTGPQYPSPQGSQLRLGYMLGFSCEYNKRWLFDALVQQGSVNSNLQGGYNINSALSSAYYRLTIGYKLIK